MRIRPRHIILGIIIFAAAFFGIYPSLANPRVFSICQDIDLNSGDIQEQINVCFVRIKDEVQTTPFSREVRRLGIVVPQERRWVRAYTKVLTIACIFHLYGETFSQCNSVMRMFEDGHIPDEERLIIVKRILTNWQSKDPRDLHKVNEELEATAEKVYKVPADHR